MIEVRVRDTLALPDSAIVRSERSQGREHRQPSAPARQGHRDQGGRDRRRSTTQDLQGADRLARARVRLGRGRDRRARPRQGPQAPARAQGADLPAGDGLRHGLEGRQRGGPDRGRDEHERHPRVLPAERRDRLGLRRGGSRACTTIGSSSRTRSSTSSLPQAEGAPVALDVAGEPDQLPAARLRRPAGDRRSTSARWDPKTKQAVDRQREQRRPRRARRGIAAQLGRERPRRRHDDARRPRGRQHRGGQRARQERAQTRRADAYLEAEGTAFGNPKVKAGATVQIKGVGTKFGGTLPHHVRRRTSPRRRRGYQTSFQISGRSERGLLDLDAPARAATTGTATSWSAW